MQKTERLAAGLRLQQARIKAGYKTSADGARAVEMSGPAYWRVEKGQNKLTIELATRCARKFATNVNWLLTGEGENTLPGVGAPKAMPPLPNPARAVIALVRGGMSKGLKISVNVGDATFLFPLEDRAMLLPGHLQLGDSLAFDPGQQLHNGDLGLFQVPDEPSPLIRRYIKLKGGAVRLAPHDSAFETLDFKKGEALEVMGRFVFLIRSAEAAY